MSINKTPVFVSAMEISIFDVIYIDPICPAANLAFAFMVFRPVSSL